MSGDGMGSLAWSWFRITFGRVEIHRSARKHGVTDGDILHAASQFLVAYPLGEEDEGPRRELRLGPDRAGNLLEVVACFSSTTVASWSFTLCA